jgi:hypothetical protein
VQEVRRALDTAQCVVILWSEAAMRSGFLQQEIHQAIRAWSSDRLMLAALDDTPLPVGLRDLSPISIESASSSGVEILIERAQAIVQRGAIASSPHSIGSTRAGIQRDPHAAVVLPRSSQPC